MRCSGRTPEVTASSGFWLALAGLWLLLGREALAPILAAGLHELGHLAALRALGIPTEGLELGAAGAVLRVRLRGEPREVWALLAGPGVNLLLALGLRRVWPDFALWNLGLGLYNLLPLPPLDGGRALGLILPRLFGRAGAVFCRLLAWVVVLGALGLGIWGTCVLRLGLLPILGAGFFLLRAPMGVDKTGEGW